MRNVALMGNIIYVVCFYRDIYGTMKVRILWNCDLCAKHVQDMKTSSLISATVFCSGYSDVNVTNCPWRFLMIQMLVHYPTVVKLITSRRLSGQILGVITQNM